MNRVPSGRSASDSLYERLASVILAVSKLHPIRVGIDGIDNAGKTTLANKLTPLLELENRPVIRATIDGFHNPKEVRYRLGRRSPEGYYRDSFNLQGLNDELLRPLGPAGDCVYRSAIYDVRMERPVDTPKKAATKDSVLVFDGVFLSQPTLRTAWDLLIYLRVSFETALARAIDRDRHLGADRVEIQEIYKRRYFPGQRLYHHSCAPEARADIVVDNTDFHNPQWVRTGRLEE